MFFALYATPPHFSLSHRERAGVRVRAERENDVHRSGRTLIRLPAPSPGGRRIRSEKLRQSTALKLASVLEGPLGNGYLEGRVTKHRRGYAVDSGQSVYRHRHCSF